MIKKVVFSILFILLISFQVNAQNYNIEVFLDSDRGQIVGESKVLYKNFSKESIDKIYFRTDLNYGFNFRINEVIDRSSSTVLPGEFYKYEYLNKLIEDPTMYQVLLPKPLEPLEQIDLILKFYADGLYKENDILYILDSFEQNKFNSWYPRAVYLKNNEWNYKENESSLYNVKITTSSDNLVITSSKLAEIKDLSKEKKQYIYKGVQLRGFDIICTKNLSIDQLNVEGIEIKVYFRAKKPKWFKRISEITKEILTFYKTLFDFYPYNNLYIVPGNEKQRGGVVSNNVIVIHDTLDNYQTNQEVEDFLHFFLSTAIAKQYFGSYIGDSNNYPKWLTNGLSLYFSRLYIDSKNLSRTRYNQIIDNYIEAAISNFDTTLFQPIDKLNYTGKNWEKIMEGKAFSIMNMLEFLIGKNNMIKIAQKLFEIYPNQIVSIKNFVEIAKEVSQKDLDTFFEQWFYTNKKLDYSIKEAKIIKEDNKTKLFLKIAQLQEIVMPLTITVTLSNGDKKFQIINPVAKETELTFQVPSNITTVTIDEGNRLPDIDRKNNKFIFK